MEYHEVQRRERGAGVGTAAVREGKGRAVLQVKRECGVRRQTDMRSCRTVLHVIFVACCQLALVRVFRK